MGESRFSRWQHPLLQGVLALILVSVLSGFALLFFRSLFPHLVMTVTLLHWWGSLILLAAILPYLLFHVRLVWALRATLTFKLGFLTGLFLLFVATSGVVLWPRLSATPAEFLLVRLLHTVVGGAFILLLASHLVAVGRALFARHRSSATAAFDLSVLIGAMVTRPLLLAAAAAVLLLCLL